MLAKQQRKEIRQMDASSEESSAREFRERVLRSTYEAQKNIAPYLEIPVLRRIIKTFTNDAREDFEKWACNPLVLEMLKKAKSALDEGRITEQDAENVMIESLLGNKEGNKSGGAGSYETIPPKPSGKKIRVETNNLVSALNEHVQLRMNGNALYEVKHFPEALQKYNEALSIVNLVEGTNPGDQHEIDKNKVATLMNIGATHMGTQDFGAAICMLTEANQLMPNHPKLLIRRARAFTQRGEFAKAREDVALVESFQYLDPYEIATAKAEIDKEERRSLKAEQRMARKAFS